jgi:hypothetical protein
MNALIRNDLRWAWPLALLGNLLFLLALLALPPIDIWVLPTNTYAEVMQVLIPISATLLAWWATFRDDLLRTREYRLHRPQSAGRVFWARHLVGLAAVASWILMVPTIHLLGALAGANGPLVDASRLSWFITQTAPALLFYGLAVFLASSTRSIVGGMTLSFVGGGTLLAVTTMIIYFASVAHTVWAAAICLLLTPLLLLGAQRSHRQGRDPDRPWTDARIALTGTSLVAVLVVVGGLVVTCWQVFTRDGLFDTYPQILARSDGPVLVRWLDDEKSPRRVDEQHRTGELLTRTAAPVLNMAGSNQRWVAPRSSLSREPSFVWASERFRGGLYQKLPVEGPIRREAYVGSDGYLTIVNRALLRGRGEDRPSMRRVGKDPDGRPFSPDSQLLPTWKGVLLVFDPRDGGLWRYDRVTEAAGFTPMVLPDGDRFIRLVPPRNVVGALKQAGLTVAGPVVQTERGYYAWQGDHFVSLPANATEAVRDFPRPDVVPVGPVGLDVRLKSASGVEFHHVFQPRTPPERAIAALHRGSTLLRPPVLALPGVWADRDRAFELGPALLLDRPVVLGDRGPLIACCALSLALAALRYRRLRKLGAPVARCRYWAVAIALGGAPALLCHLLVERRRAWEPMPAEAEPRPATLLLQSA